MYKKFMFILIFVLALFSNFPSFAQDFKLSEWQSQGDKSGRIENIVFVPIKKNNLLNITNEKYSQELAYYFYKSGFKATPASAVLFQDSSEYYILNPLVERSIFSNSLNLNTAIIFLVYNNEFNLDRFTPGLTTFSSNELKKLVMNSSVNSISNLDLRRIKTIENQKIIFTDLLDQTPEIRKKLNIDFNSKSKFEMSLDGLVIPFDASPNELITVGFVIRNTSASDIAFNKSFNISFRFDKDSRFFVSGLWSNTRVALLVNEGFVENGQTRVFSTTFRAPILPGEYKDVISFYNNETKYGQKEVIIRVKDIGQKVLRIKNVMLGLSVRKDPTTSSQEINKVGNGAEFIFTEEKNGFYKIHLLDGKTGWVSGNYVDIIKR